MIASEEKARALGIEPLGVFLGSAVAGVDPRVMGIGPIPAVQKLLARTGVDVGALDLVELNEAFASQSLAVVRELGLDPDKVNVNGGAIALGHPLGMSGARLVVSLLHELRRRSGRYGLRRRSASASARSQARRLFRATQRLADRRADVDHVFVLRRHEGRADAHDHALDVGEDLLRGLLVAVGALDHDAELVDRLSP